MIYEIMTIIPSQFAETEVDAIITKVAQVFAKHEAKVEKTHNFGKVKMAYPIEMQRYGTYVLFYVMAGPEMVSKIDTDLKLSEDVLRHLIVARPEGIPKSEGKLVQYTPPLTPEGRRAGERDRDERPERAPRPTVEATSKVTTEELASKLDQILDSDIMKNI